MPKIAALPICVTAVDKVTKIAYKADASVGLDGIFSVELDARLEKSADHLLRDPEFRNIGTKPTPNGHRVIGKSLDEVRRFIEHCAANELKCEVKTERVIVYGYDIFAHACQASDGSLHPNGHYAGREGKWIELATNTFGSEVREHYSVGFAAVVREKTTYTRPTGTVVKYDQPDKVSHFADTDPMMMLNAFVKVKPKLDGGQLPSGFKEMPYTEEAALFFYQTMMNIVNLASTVRNFFSNAPMLLNAIKTGANLLGGPKGS